MAVADELNFTRAAERLGLGQQALSASVRRLEAELGVVLFERSPRQVALTEAGAAFLEEARVLLAASRVALSNVRQAASVETCSIELDHERILETFGPGWEEHRDRFLDVGPSCRHSIAVRAQPCHGRLRIGDPA